MGITKKAVDCVIVGAGIIGMLTARALLRQGLSVTLVDKGPAGGESSWAGGGILSPLYPWRYERAVNVLARWSQAEYPRLAAQLHEESGVDPQWTASGLLLLDEGEDEQAGAWSRTFQSPLETVDGVQCKALEPSLGEVPASALWMPQVAQVRNPRLARALRLSLLKQDAVFHEGEAVTGLVTQGRRVLGVRTAQGRLIAAAMTVVAGGAWSAHILQASGVQLDIRPVRGQMLLYRAPVGLVRRIVMKAGHYVIPRRDGRVLVGSSVEDVGFDKSTTGEVKATLQAVAQALVPALADCPLERHWSGLRPGSKTGVPYIGAVPQWEGLYINSGHFRNGVVLGPASAALLAALMTGGETPVDPQPYALARHPEPQADFLSV